MSIKETNGHVSTTESKQKPDKKPWWHINKDMLRYKAHFVFFIGAMGSALPYLPVIARNRLGVSATSLAVVLTAQQFITIFTKPLIGYIVDYFNKLKLMLFILIIMQTICLFLLLVIPPINQTTSNSQVMNDILKHDEHSEIMMLEINNCDIFQMSSTSKTLNATEKDIIVSDDVTNYDLMCMKQFNMSTIICHKHNIRESMNRDQTNHECNCSVNISDLKSFTDYLKSHFLDSLYYLSSNELNVSFQNVKEMCSIDSFEENSKLYLLEEPVTKSQFATLEFWIFAIVLITAGIGTSSIFTLGDTACYEGVQKYNSDFGRQRVYGAVGWGGFAPIGGLLCDLTNDFLAAWLLMLALQILALWNIWKLDLVKPNFSQNICKDVGSVLKSFEFLAFDLAVFMNGFGAGIMWFYLIWFLTSMGGSKFLLGLVQYVQCFVGEIPFMFFSGWFINKLGHFNLMSLSLLSYSIRFMWYSYLKNPWLVLPIEVVHAFTYGTFYPAVASFGKLAGKPGTEATTQSILFTTHEGLGAGLGCVVAGVGFDYIGGHLTFYYVSLFAFCATLLNSMNTVLLRKKHSQTLQVSSPKK